MANRPKPTKVKQLEGNPGKRPLNKKEPIPIYGEPDCPDFLTKDARVEFFRVCLELKGMGLLHSSDRGIIACLAESWADWREARKQIAKRGRWVAGTSASKEIYFQHFPWMTLEKRAKTEILKFSVELGLSPSARSRIQISEKTEGDEMELYLTGGKKPGGKDKDKHVH